MFVCVAVSSQLSEFELVVLEELEEDTFEEFGTVINLLLPVKLRLKPVASQLSACVQ
jgi:hypothetical protein